MIRSMTGYGRGAAEKDGLAFQVEIKAVNHRYGDVTVKAPRSLMPFENALKKRVNARLHRGKIDVYITQEATDLATVEPVLNRPMADAYMALFDQMQQDYAVLPEIPLGLLAGQKDVFILQEKGVDEALLGACLWQAVDAAIASIVTMREQEGASMVKDIQARLDATAEMIASAQSRAPEVVVEWQQKLSERLQKRQAELEVDPQRLAQELAIFADRCDITEEITRYHSHIEQFRALLTSSEPVGRKLDFLVQELNREVNTIGSKANDAVLTRLVVDIKAELEKIREQVQNLE